MMFIGLLIASVYAAWVTWRWNECKIELKTEEVERELAEERADFNDDSYKKAKRELHRLREEMRADDLPDFLEENPDIRQQVLLAFGGMEREHPFWRSVQLLVLKQAGIEQSAALMPDVANPERQYRAGRAAALADFRAMLNSTFAASRKPPGQ